MNNYYEKYMKRKNEFEKCLNDENEFIKFAKEYGLPLPYFKEKDNYSEEDLQESINFINYIQKEFGEDVTKEFINKCTKQASDKIYNEMTNNVPNKNIENAINDPNNTMHILFSNSTQHQLLDMMRYYKNPEVSSCKGITKGEFYRRAEIIQELFSTKVWELFHFSIGFILNKINNNCSNILDISNILPKLIMDIMSTPFSQLSYYIKNMRYSYTKEQMQDMVNFVIINIYDAVIPSIMNKMINHDEAFCGDVDKIFNIVQNIIIDSRSAIEFMFRSLIIDANTLVSNKEIESIILKN